MFSLFAYGVTFGQANLDTNQTNEHFQEERKTKKHPSEEHYRVVQDKFDSSRSSPKSKPKPKTPKH